MSLNTVRGLASVIVPCWNQLEFTRKCISALFRQTGGSWELIVVDNGSTDGTGSYLAGVQDSSPVPVTVIANATNQGFPAAINQGLEFARGEFLVLLNNDVVVTDGWLAQLIALTAVTDEAKKALTLESEARNGAAGLMDIQQYEVVDLNTQAVDPDSGSGSPVTHSYDA